MTLVEFLRYAGTSAGVNAVIGFALSFVAEWWPGYDELSPRAKRLIMMGLCFVVPVAAFCGLWLLGEVGDHTGSPLLDGLWLAVLAGFSSFFGSQAAHVRNLSLKAAKEARWIGLEAMSNDVVAVCSELIECEKERRRAEGLSDDVDVLFGQHG